MPGVAYLDFDLQIQRVGTEYRVEADAPAGQTAATFVLPFSDLELENFLLKMGRARPGVRRIDSPEVEAAKTFGERLFAAVFADELRGVLRSSIEEARRQGAGLRIRLRLADAPELADLPWEYLYNPTFNRFLSLSVDTPIVRYLDLPELVKPLAVTPPLNALVMIASPAGYPPLDVEREWDKLREALKELLDRGVVALDRLDEPTLAALQRRLRRGEYHVFHFIGHGGFVPTTQDGVLVLEDEERRSRLVSGQDLGVMLHDHRSMRLVVLNACEGARASRSDPFAGVAQSLVQQGMAAVVAMQFEITDEAAITFSHEFYGALADGYPVDASLAEARKAIFAQENGLEWGTPVLHLRAPDGRIFDVPEGPRPRRRTTEEPIAGRRGEGPTGEIPAATADVRAETRDESPMPHPSTRSDEQDRRRRPRRLWIAAAMALVIAGAAGAWRQLDRGPIIERFMAEPTRVVVGGRATLRWEVDGAEAIEIVPSVGPAALDPRAGTVSVRLAEPGTHTFTLRVRRARRISEQTVSIVVRRPPPIIKTFMSALDTARGGRTVLMWEVEDATMVRLDPGPGRVPSTGNVAVAPPPAGRTVTYRLTAGNPDHPDVVRDLTVAGARSPIVVVSPPRTPGPMRTLRPTVRGTPRAIPSPRRTPRPDASVVMTQAPRATTPVIAPTTPLPQATPEVPVPAASVEVSLARTTLALGDSTQLCWIAFNAQSGRIDPDIGDLPPAEVEKGCRTVSPRQTTTYTITVAGRDGRSVRKQITVEVQVLEVQILAFSVRKSFLAPGEMTQICWSVANGRSVRLDPDFGELPRSDVDRGCRDIAPRTTTTYFLIATGRDGKTVTRTLVVAVRLR